MELPAEGAAPDAVMAELAALREHDVRWADGRAFGLVYDGGPAVHEVAERAAALFLHENALNTRAFPSLARIQADVVGWTASLVHAPSDAAGFLTSGGTESLLCAVLAARERGRAERGVVSPHMVLAESAHAAFHKAAHLFGVRVTTVAVRADFTADPDAIAAAITPDTVLLVASAPQYPQGVVDPVPEIAALAAAHGIGCHVDACMGGFVLPFAERLGRAVAPWDFRVPGVTSLSADVHKLGYAPKGVSVILYANRGLRAHQTFDFDGWLGGRYGSPNLQGTRPGMPMAAAWAVMRRLGTDGYVELTRRALAAADRMRDVVRSLPGLRVLADGTLHIVPISADPVSPVHVDVFALGDALARRGWYLDRQGPPDSLHATVSNSNADHMHAYERDLRAAYHEVLGTRTAERSTAYSTIE